MKKILKKNVKEYTNANLYVTPESTVNSGCTDTKPAVMADDNGTHICP